MNYRDSLDLMNEIIRRLKFNAGAAKIPQPEPRPPEPDSDCRKADTARALGQHPARTTDPTTSHQATDSLNLPRLEMIVLDFIRAVGTVGATADDIVDCTGLPWRTATPRIRPLIRKGLVVDTRTVRRGRSGRNQRVVRAV